MSLNPRLLTLAGLIAAAPACKTRANCGGATIIDPDIKVTDAVTGQSICDATVVATATPSSYDAEVPVESFVPAGAADCRWRAAAICPPQCTVTLVVSKAGYKTAMASATWYVSGCGSTDPIPKAQQVDVRLTPG